MATDQLERGAHVLVGPGSESNGETDNATENRRIEKKWDHYPLIFNLSHWLDGALRERGSSYLCYFILEIRMNNICPFRLHHQVWEFCVFFFLERKSLASRAFSFRFRATHVWGTKWLKQIPLANSHSKRSIFSTNINPSVVETRSPLIPAPTNRFFSTVESRSAIHSFTVCVCLT